MSEYIQNVGRRAQLRQESFEKGVTFKSHLESLRLALDPLAAPWELDENKIIALAVALGENVARIKEIREQLKGIENIIGK